MDLPCLQGVGGHGWLYDMLSVQTVPGHILSTFRWKHLIISGGKNMGSFHQSRQYGCRWTIGHLLLDNLMCSVCIALKQAFDSCECIIHDNDNLLTMTIYWISQEASSSWVITHDLPDWAWCCHHQAQCQHTILGNAWNLGIPASSLQTSCSGDSIWMMECVDKTHTPDTYIHIHTTHTMHCGCNSMPTYEGVNLIEISENCFWENIHRIALHFCLNWLMFPRYKQMELRAETAIV